MAKKDGKDGHKLDPAVVKRLLDGLATDDDFRSHFERDAQSALESIGYVAPTEDSIASAGSCMQMKGGATLAPADKIASDRASLEQTLNAIQNFATPRGLVA
jgi:putative modified peptide